MLTLLDSPSELKTGRQHEQNKRALLANEAPLREEFFSLIRLEKQRHVQQGVDAGEKRVINFESEE